MAQATWNDVRDAEHPVRVEFAGGDPDSWLSVEDALDRIDPIDRDAAREALLDGAKFRTFGAWYQFLLLCHHHLSLDRSGQSSCAEVRSVRNSLRPVPAMFLTERANGAICLMGERQLGGK